MKDNNVYRWSYKEVKDAGSYGDYHCMSQIAISKNGILYDTFWHEFSGRSSLDKSKVNLEYRGNLDEMTSIHRGDEIYYKREDIVDMSHSNNSRAKIYTKPNVKRDEKTILELIKSREEFYNREIYYANKNLDDLETQMKNVLAGNLNDVWVPCI